YVACCEPYHLGRAKAPAAAALMRSRYCAYVRGLIDYLVCTTLPAVRTTDLWVNYKSTADSIQWIGLEVLGTQQGGVNDKIGKVEFKASYIQDGERVIHHELSRFRRSGGDWYYLDGVVEES
ncbi:MAG: SEC-C motif-containing protein, partial [Lentimonas sp.]